MMRYFGGLDTRHWLYPKLWGYPEPGISVVKHCVATLELSENKLGAECSPVGLVDRAGAAGVGLQEMVAPRAGHLS